MVRGNGHELLSFFTIATVWVSSVAWASWGNFSFLILRLFKNIPHLGLYQGIFEEFDFFFLRPSYDLLWPLDFVGPQSCWNPAYYGCSMAHHWLWRMHRTFWNHHLTILIHGFSSFFWIFFPFSGTYTGLFLGFVSLILDFSLSGFLVSFFFLLDSRTSSCPIYLMTSNIVLLSGSKLMLIIFLCHWDGAMAIRTILSVFRIWNERCQKSYHRDNWLVAAKRS